ncbi:DUF4198 domain-containing protein [Sphingomonas sp. LT1P40]|uniref:DUF4198 domain-containing protein n=1 Tax=Alteristakelama amylovorans TaxID=3096166 RepID=UPI002FCC6B08
MKKLLIAALALSVVSAAQAHEVWIERGANGKAQIWLGEPEKPIPAAGDPAFPMLKAPKLVPASTAAQTRGPGYIEVALPPGDVRAWDDNIFKPWTEDGKAAGGAYYARSGRAETKALMPLEIVPVAANGNTFTLIREGKPAAAGIPVTVVSPERWMMALETDANGQFTVTTRESGRYIIKAEVKDEGDFATPGGKVAILTRLTTTSFVAP